MGTDRWRRALAARRRRAQVAQPRGSGNTSRVRKATRLQRSDIPLRRSDIPLRRSGIRLRRSVIPLRNSGIRLRRSDTPLPHSGIPLQRRVTNLRRECRRRATAAVAPHAALAAAAGRAALAEAIARAAALHTVAATVDGAAAGSLSEAIGRSRRSPPSRIEPRAQVGRDHGAQAVAPSENTIATARDEVIDYITQRPRNCGRERRYYLPSSSQSPKDMNTGSRAYEQRAVMGLYDHAFGQIGALVGKNPRPKRFSLQWGKSERRSQAVVLQDKSHPAMTQSAMPIVEYGLSWLCERGAHPQLLYRGSARRPASR